MGEHAGLGGNLVVTDHAVEHLQQLADGADAVGGRVNADHGIAVAVQQAVEDAGGNACRVISGVVGLQAGGHPPAQAHGVAKTGDDADLLRHQHQILHAHDLRHRCGHFRRQPRGQRLEAGLGGIITQQPVAKAADRQVTDRREGCEIVAVDDQAGDFILLVGDQRFVEKALERHVRQGHLRRCPLGVAAGGDFGQIIPGAGRTGLGHELAQAVETPDHAADAVGKAHSLPPLFFQNLNRRQQQPRRDCGPLCRTAHPAPSGR